MDSLTSPMESLVSPRIPQEIIVAIVSEVLSVCDRYDDELRRENFEQLKVLRLTHRRFADCSYLNELLFTNIRLEPRRASRQPGDYSRVACYTRSITFEAYASWELVSGTWERLILFDIPGRPRNVRTLSHTNDALEAQRLLEDPDGDLIETWTNVLKMVGSRLEKVKVVSDRYSKNLYSQDPDPMRDWEDFCFRVPGTEIEPHEDTTRRLRDEDDENAECAKDYAHAIVGERLFNTVITCLSASGVTISSLTIEPLLLGRLECTEIPAWRQLDLSKLKHLNLEPLYPFVPYALRERTSMAAFLRSTRSFILKRLGNMVHNFIDKCHSTVETLIIWDEMEMDTDLRIVWPTRAATYELPALREFDHGMAIHPRLLHDWLLRMKNLRSFTVHRGLARQHPANRRHVLDAVRDHPNVSGPDPKGLSFGFPGTWEYGSVVCQDRSIASPRYAPGEEHSNYPLEAHLYGEIEYSLNVALRRELGDDGHWGGGSDEEDEDDDMEGVDESEEEEEE